MHRHGSTPAIIPRVEQAIAEHGSDRLRPIFVALDETVDYETIRTITVCWTNRQSPLVEEKGAPADE